MLRKQMLAMALLSAAAMGATAGSTYATLYTADTNVADFTAGMTFATFTDFFSGDVSAPYTPTAANIASGLRIFNYSGALTITGVGNCCFLATFPSAVSSIRVFPNIDHLGFAPDYYQYKIWGSNDLSTFTPLFDALTVTGTPDPAELGSFTGTAPTSVNAVLTPGAGPNGTVGYEADFTFGTAYKYYAFGASTVGLTFSGDDELSGVGTAGVAVPAPLIGRGLPVLLAVGGILFGAKLLERSKTRRSLRTAVPHATA